MKGLNFHVNHLQLVSFIQYKKLETIGREPLLHMFGCLLPGYLYERLDGSVRGEERFLAVQKFNENEETFVFLLSTKAGTVLYYIPSIDTSFELSVSGYLVQKARSMN